MSYLVLARKSRPQTFAEVVGQKPIVRTLQNALRQHRVPHALIFSGVRGTGKTTLARIMAKAINCEQLQEAGPCNQCRSCRDITEGTSIDLQEVDGASNRGIQEIRELKEKIRFMPTNSRYKIIIIDEVHMLTTEAFNALLKTLEEPPEHVYFMFATTELHKVPVTILSRCQRYELKRLGHRELADHFQRLAEGEGVTMDPAGLDMIVREAGGSVRDGLSLLDQIFSYCGQQVHAEEVIEVLGLVSHRLVADLGTALLTGDLGTVYTLLDEMYAHGTDIKRFSNDLLNWFRGLIVCKVNNKPNDLLDIPEEDVAGMVAVAAKYSLESLSALFNLLVTGLEKAITSQQPRLTLELTFIQAIQCRDIVPVSDLLTRFDQLLAGQPLPSLPPTATPAVSSNQPRPPQPPQTMPPPGAASPQSADPEPGPAAQQAVPPGVPQKKTKKNRTQPESQPLAAPESQAPQSVQAPVPPPPKQETGSVPHASGPKNDTRKIRQQWDAFLCYVHERMPWMSATLKLASSVERKEEELLVHFDHSADCTLLKQNNYIESLTEFALDFFQEALHIQFVVPGSDACRIDPSSGQAAQQERRSLANDPLVLTALDVFTGQVGDIRIGPRYRQRSEELPEEKDGEPVEQEEP